MILVADFAKQITTAQWCETTFAQVVEVSYIPPLLQTFEPLCSSTSHSTIIHIPKTKCIQGGVMVSERLFYTVDLLRVRVRPF